jgi:hypothetical protein
VAAPYASGASAGTYLIMKSCALAAFAAASTSSSVAPGFPVRMLSAIVPPKRTGSCWRTHAGPVRTVYRACLGMLLKQATDIKRTHPDITHLVPEPFEVEGADIHAIEFDAALERIIET